MYINVGMPNREKRPQKERDDIYFTHIAIHTILFRNDIVGVEVCVCVCILYTGGVCCGCCREATFCVRSSESLCWMMCVVELLGGHVA